MNDDQLAPLMRIARYSDLLVRQGQAEPSVRLSLLVDALEAYLDGGPFPEQEVFSTIEDLDARAAQPSVWQSTERQMGPVRRARAIPTPPEVAFVVRKTKPVRQKPK